MVSCSCIVTYSKSASHKTKISVETAEKFVYQAD